MNAPPKNTVQLTKRDVAAWAELLQLVAQMVMAAVEALNDDDPVDFEAVKIAVTPEEALRRAQHGQSGD